MPGLKVEINGKNVSLNYSDKFASGVFLVKPSTKAKENCQILKIEFDRLLPENILQNKITNFGRFSLLTLYVAENYLQYIIFRTATPEDIEDLATQLSPPTAKLIRLASDFASFDKSR